MVTELNGGPGVGSILMARGSMRPYFTPLCGGRLLNTYLVPTNILLHIKHKNKIEQTTKITQTYTYQYALSETRSTCQTDPETSYP